MVGEIREWLCISSYDLDFESTFLVTRELPRNCFEIMSSSGKTYTFWGDFIDGFSKIVCHDEG